MNGEVKLMKQQTLDEAAKFAEIEKVKGLSRIIDKCIRNVGNKFDSEDIAVVIGKAYPTVRNWLNSNGDNDDRKHPVFALGYYVHKDPDTLIEDFVAPLCDLCGYESPVKKLPPDPGQQLRDIKTKLKGLKLNDHPDFKEYF